MHQILIVLRHHSYYVNGSSLRISDLVCRCLGLLVSEGLRSAAGLQDMRTLGGTAVEADKGMVSTLNSGDHKGRGK